MQLPSGLTVPSWRCTVLLDALPDVKSSIITRTCLPTDGTIIKRAKSLSALRWPSPNFLWVIITYHWLTDPLCRACCLTSSWRLRSLSRLLGLYVLSLLFVQFYFSTRQRDDCISAFFLGHPISRECVTMSVRRLICPLKVINDWFRVQPSDLAKCKPF